jgi:hypothetical protein
MASLAAAAVKMLPSLLDLLRPGWIIGVMADGGHACAVWQTSCIQRVDIGNTCVLMHVH